ncbi:MAG TPA: DUF4124 domain-containing protein [Pseudomonadales bacterium]
MRLNVSMNATTDPSPRCHASVCAQHCTSRGLVRRLAALLTLTGTLLLGSATPAATVSIEPLGEYPERVEPAGPVAAYFRWIDGDGRVQYTDFEPAGIPSQRIPLAPPPADDAPAISRSAEDRPVDTFHHQDAQILPIEHIGPCADARRQLTVLYSDMPVYLDDRRQYRTAWRGDSYRGQRSWLGADDRTAAIARARDAVLAQCSDPDAFEKEVQAFESELGKR